ncbi:hypothetical protein MAFF212519_16510 [Clavibacter michiganensis]
MDPVRQLAGRRTGQRRPGGERVDGDSTYAIYGTADANELRTAIDAVAAARTAPAGTTPSPADGTNSTTAPEEGIEG